MRALSPEEIAVTLGALMKEQIAMAKNAANAKELNLSENHHYFMMQVCHLENAYKKILAQS